MTHLVCKTRGNSSPIGKRKVYFCCHSDDFDKYYNKICDDIWASHDCAIYYLDGNIKDMAEFEFDLCSMNLFVVPVTYTLLCTENRAMSVDIAYAKANHIPILPFMMDAGSDALYSRPDKFGELQYINPYSTDATELSYSEKLDKYLESTLISNEMAETVRAAFDTYIFLSYRKKDRRYANELMKLIHAKPECRDIAIWYDEFLTPGESFKDNIDKMLKKCKLFTLLVTPNLLEKDNYVMKVEYPTAKKAGMRILAAEMVATDKAELEKSYDEIPDCVNAHTDELYSRLSKSLKKRAVRENDSEHDYLIGLAYLEGIDVEVDRERALNLITGAAKAGYPIAMKKLSSMYYNGNYVALDWKMSLYWAERIAEHYQSTLGDDHPETIDAIKNVVYMENLLGNFSRALKLCTDCYERCRRIFGDNDKKTLSVLFLLPNILGNLGYWKKAKELLETAYTSACAVYGREYPETLYILNNLSIAHSRLGDYKKAFEIIGEVYSLSCSIHGEENIHTLISLNNLAMGHGEIGEWKNGLELCKRSYELHCKTLGEKHPNTLYTLHNIAYMNGKLKNWPRATEVYERVYAMRSQVLGVDHPDTLFSLHNLAEAYGYAKDLETSRKLYQKAYEGRVRAYGKTHKQTVTTLNNLALIYKETGDDDTCIKLLKRAYEDISAMYGEGHPETFPILENLAAIYEETGDLQTAYKLYKQNYKFHFLAYGEYYIETLNAFYPLLELNIKLGLKPFEYEEKSGYLPSVVRSVFADDSDFTPEVVYVPENKNAENEKKVTVRLPDGTECDAQEYFCDLPDKENKTEAVPKKEETPKNDTPGDTADLLQLAYEYRKKDDYKNALSLLVKVCSKREQLLGKRHPETLYALDILYDLCEEIRYSGCDKTAFFCELAYAYFTLGDHKNALKYFKKLYKLRRRALGDEHESTLETLMDIAFVYFSQKKYKKAISLREKEYAILLRTLGGDHPKTKKSRELLETLRSVAGV